MKYWSMQTWLILSVIGSIGPDVVLAASAAGSAGAAGVAGAPAGGVAGAPGGGAPPGDASSGVDLRLRRVRFSTSVARMKSRRARWYVEPRISKTQPASVSLGGLALS